MGEFVSSGAQFGQSQVIVYGGRIHALCATGLGYGTFSINSDDNVIYPINRQRRSPDPVH